MPTGDSISSLQNTIFVELFHLTALQSTDRHSILSTPPHYIYQYCLTTNGLFLVNSSKECTTSQCLV